MGRKKRPHQVGADLGNANSTLSVIVGRDRVVHFKNEAGDVAEPSVIFYMESGEPVFGFAAVNAERTAPDRVVRHFKRAMDEEGENGESPVIFIHDGQPLTAEDAAMLFFAHLKRGIEEQEDREAADVVATCPANYTDLARFRLLQAALRAGFKRVRLLDEPTAAALAYGLEREAEGVLLVFDLGGGTFDVTVLRIRDGHFEALATGGEHNMGGIDMENPIIDLIQETHREHTGQEVDIRADAALLSVVREEVVRAKHALSSLPSTPVAVIIGDHRVSFEMTRERFENLIENLLERMRAVLTQTVEKASLTMDALEHVVLVGGATKVPAVQALVQEVTGKEPKRDIDPTTAVAHGAALYAKIVNWDEDSDEILDHSPTTDPAATWVRENVKDLRLIAAHALGVKAKLCGDHERAGELVLAPVCPPQAPVGKEFTRRFAPEHPLQPSVDIVVLQGQPEAPVAECVVLGQFSLPIAARDSVEESVEVSFEHDRDGRARVRARDLVSGKAEWAGIDLRPQRDREKEEAQ